MTYDKLIAHLTSVSLLNWTDNVYKILQLFMPKVPCLYMYENLKIYEHKYKIINKNVIIYSKLFDILAEHCNYYISIYIKMDTIHVNTTAISSYIDELKNAV